MLNAYVSPIGTQHTQNIGAWELSEGKLRSNGRILCKFLDLGSVGMGSKYKEHPISSWAENWVLSKDRHIQGQSI